MPEEAKGGVEGGGGKIECRREGERTTETPMPGEGVDDLTGEENERYLDSLWGGER